MSAPLWFLTFTLGQLGFVFAAGVASLFVYRRGHAARMVERAAAARGARALLLDFGLALRLTWCGCLTHAAARGLPEPRAIRFLWWTSALRATTLLVLALTGLLIPALLFIFTAGALAPRFIGARAALSRAAVFVAREPRGRSTLREVVVDAARETGEMWRAYGLILVVVAALAAAWAGASPSTSDSALLTLGLAVLGLLARVDLIAALPLVVAAHLWGFPPDALVAFAVACEVHSVRTRRLFTSYLTTDAAARYLRFTRAFALAFALALALL